QVQDLPIPAPELRMVVMRVDAEGVGLQFVRED
ncbi:MAG: PilZ domain-containing protein, partial [Gammaproteobacteria bacterium HGW-Gammaproteobacteria-9]